MSSENEIARALASGQAQASLFDAMPSRSALRRLELPEDPDAPARLVHVWRNHAFEPLVELIEPYARFGRWRPRFSLSDYDDSLMFGSVPQADLHLLWLDADRLRERLPDEDWIDWMHGRVSALRRRTTSPILLVTWLGGELAERLARRLAGVAGVQLGDLQALCVDDDCPLLDARNATWAGSPLSRQAQVAAARALACRWLPALLMPPIKAIALDLDHTLYRGVLGEDGAAGLELTEQHRALQQALLALRDKGIFLALVSRNEQADVLAMFEARADFPLAWRHFSAHEVSWGEKSAALGRIAAQLRIGLDAIVYVDDNPGELARAAQAHPALRTVWAAPDARQTLATLDHFPGLWRWTSSQEDGRRIEDLAAHAERETLAAQSQDADAYFRSLQVRLGFRAGDAADLPRLADLCVKTNQFNLSLARLNIAQLQGLAEDPAASLCAVSLSDRLSDSGIIAALAARREGDRLDLLELCISCRALGRQLEDSIVLLALRHMPALAGCRSIGFEVGHGPRNQPARAWLAGWLGHDPGPGRHEIDAERVRQFTPPAGVALQFQ